MSDESAFSEAWPVKAYKNDAFLNSPQAREIRILCELTEPKSRLRREGIQNTIIFFGSARIPSPEAAEQRLAEARADLAKMPDDACRQRAVRVAERLHRASPYHSLTRDLAKRLSEWSQTIEDERKRFYVCTGAGPGLMEAANLGAHLAGAKSVGLGISLPFEPEHNPYVPKELAFEFHYFMVRKYWFAYTAKAMVVCPGGFGTMDEFFEMMTLIQTHKTEKYVPTVLLGKTFWNDVVHFDKLLDWGVISEEDLNLFHICDDVEEAASWIISELTKHYLSPHHQRPEPFEKVRCSDGT